MKTINFYELLELVKDGKAPKKINFDSRGWVFQGNQYSAINGDGANIWSGYNFNILNDEVEIIEEDKEIEKLDIIPYEKCIHDVTHKEKQLALEIRTTQIAVNELIDKVNSLENKQ